MHQTKLHIEWREQDLVCQPGFIIIPPAQLEALDDALFLLVKKFLPISFYSSLEQKHSAVKHRRISVFGLIATVFGEDQSLPELTAVADRQTFEDMLSIPWLPRETASEFRSRHERNVAAYNQFSEVPRFSNTDSGVKEHTEYIILRLRKGQLKNMVTAKVDLQKLKAVSKSRSQPALPELWELIEFFSTRFSRSRRLGSSLFSRPRLMRRQGSANSMMVEESTEHINVLTAVTKGLSMVPVWQLQSRCSLSLLAQLTFSCSETGHHPDREWQRRSERQGQRQGPGQAKSERG